MRRFRVLVIFVLSASAIGAGIFSLSLGGAGTPAVGFHSPNTSRRDAFVFMMTNDLHLRSVLALNAALNDVGSTKRRIVLCSPGVGAMPMFLLNLSGISVVEIPKSPVHRNYAPSQFHWRSLLSKFEIFRVPGVDRVVFLDADITVHENIDDLFDRTEKIVTMQDDNECLIRGHPKVNSGVISAEVRHETRAKILNLLERNFVTNGDQELLDLYHEKIAKTPAATLPESYAAFVWRCTCTSWLRKKRPRPKIVHFTSWWIHPDILHKHGVNAEQPWPCSRPHYKRWLAMDQAAGVLLASKSGMLNSTAKRVVKEMYEREAKGSMIS